MIIPRDRVCSLWHTPPGSSLTAVRMKVPPDPEWDTFHRWEAAIFRCGEEEVVLQAWILFHQRGHPSRAD